MTGLLDRFRGAAGLVALARSAPFFPSSRLRYNTRISRQEPAMLGPNTAYKAVYRPLDPGPRPKSIA